MNATTTTFGDDRDQDVLLMRCILPVETVLSGSDFLFWQRKSAVKERRGTSDHLVKVSSAENQMETTNGSATGRRTMSRCATTTTTTTNGTTTQGEGGAGGMSRERERGGTEERSQSTSGV